MHCCRWGHSHLNCNSSSNSFRNQKNSYWGWIHTKVICSVRDELIRLWCGWAFTVCFPWSTVFIPRRKNWSRCCRRQQLLVECAGTEGSGSPETPGRWRSLEPPVCLDQRILSRPCTRTSPGDEPICPLRNQDPWKARSSSWWCSTSRPRLIRTQKSRNHGLFKKVTKSTNFEWSEFRNKQAD